jgi:SAM-dependent methyltransferase
MAININTMEQISWRDPAGFVAKLDGRIFRAVNVHKVAELQALLESAWYCDGVQQGWFPASAWVNSPAPATVGTAQIRWLEHRAVAFPCYPHEITSLQLYDAGKLTLAVARAALANGWIIKDASAWNILFENGKPRFCDILSFERIDDSGIWIAYAQFFRHFIIPLLLHKHAGMQTSSLFQLHRDGIQPSQARRMLHGWRLCVQPALEAVTLPAMFSNAQSQHTDGKAPKAKPPELAKFLLEKTLDRLEKHLDELKPAATAVPTTWENYQADRDHYNASDVESKRAFVGAALERQEIGTVLDLGCNAGEFSKIAAAAGKTVVSADFDHGALSRFYQELRGQALPVSPILLDIGRPTPAVGWMNREVDSFMERARGKFDCIMALGLVHHLLVSERASLPMILEFCLAIDARFLLLEWIEPADRRFVEIAGINTDLYSDISRAGFERIFSEKYEIEQKAPLGCGTRILYFLHRHGAASESGRSPAIPPGMRSAPGGSSS